MKRMISVFSGRRLTVAVGLVVGVLSLGSAEASASTVSLTPQNDPLNPPRYIVNYTAGEGETNSVQIEPVPAPERVSCDSLPTLDWEGGSGGYCPRYEEENKAVLVKDNGPGVTIEPGSACERVSQSAAVCTAPNGSVGSAEVALGDGDDSYAKPGVEVVGWKLYGEVRGGAGNDDLHGTRVTRVFGEAGDDVLVGDYWVDGGPGADRIKGNLVDYSMRTNAVKVSQDGVANDGEAGEGDNVQTSDVRGGSGDDTLSAFDEADGNAGNDSLSGSSLDGGSGNDTLRGTSGGQNYLAGGAGDDVIEGGVGGWDWLEGGAGNDELRSRDGAEDRVECGAGTDNALSDPVDVFFYSDCELNNGKRPRSK